MATLKNVELEALVSGSENIKMVLGGEGETIVELLAPPFTKNDWLLKQKNNNIRDICCGW